LTGLARAIDRPEPALGELVDDGRQAQHLAAPPRAAASFMASVNSIGVR
jgi:hypothetical protein